MGLIDLHFEICYNNDTEKKERHHISVIILVKIKGPRTNAVTHSNETHDVHFQLKYHINNHNYGYYISRGVLNFDA